jgi:hypothetical protein
LMWPGFSPEGRTRHSTEVAAPELTRINSFRPI